ncbi:MAG: flavodoxin family protein [Fibrobacter sp.]|nr:flavodoxin family protein [Fibrobacter sp.]
MTLKMTLVLNTLESFDCQEQIDTLLAGKGDKIEIINTAAMKIAHCIGCNQCWLKTPGICCIKDDYESIVKKLVKTDNLWIVSDTRFGFVDSRGKKVLDRIMPMLNMYLTFRGGWMRHELRYHALNVGLIYRGNGDQELLEDWCERTAANLGGHSLGVIALDKELNGAAQQADAPNEIAQVENPPVQIEGNAAGKSESKHVVIINGSPRAKKFSNTDKILQSFTKGLEEAGATYELYSLSSRSEWDSAREAFMTHNRTIIALPLYVECVPGTLLEFLETLPTKREQPAQLSFMLHGGFEEGRQLRLGEKFLKSLPAQFGCIYGGCLVRGGSFMIRMFNEKQTKAVLLPYRGMGEFFIEKGSFLSPELKKFTGPEQIPWPFRKLIKVLFKLVLKKKFDNFAREWGCTKPLDSKPYK